MADSVREAFDKGTDAFNAHDLGAFGETMADDVVQTAPGGMNSHGRDACMAFYGIWIEAFPDAHVDVPDVLITDDTAVEEGTFTGTHNGVFHTPMGDIPPTGRKVSWRQCHLLTVDDEGRFVDHDAIRDDLGLLRQLGVVPGAGAS